MNYWTKRQHADYYLKAVNLVKELSPAGGTLLDVGSGLQKGCRYLEWLPDFEISTIDKEADQGIRLPGITAHFGDFLEWSPPDPDYTVVMSLQCIEHVPNALAFARKMLSLAPIVVCSVPHNWQAGACKHHVHDPIDHAKLRAWFGRREDVAISAYKRLIVAFTTHGKDSHVT